MNFPPFSVRILGIRVDNAETAECSYKTSQAKIVSKSPISGSNAFQSKDLACT